jgi:hypothetical protein
MLQYLMCGLKIESEVALEDAVSVTIDTPDVVVRIARLPDAPTRCAARGLFWCLDDRGLWLDIPGIVRMRLAEGRSIEVDPNPQLPVENWAPLVSGMALGILLQLRGDIVLHASCVAIDGRAVVLCGQAGAGKSVLAAALAQLGHATVCDDLCRLVIDPVRGLLAMPEGSYTRLWPPVAAALGFRDGTPIRPPVGKSRFACRSTGEPAPVAAIYEVNKAPHVDACAIAPIAGTSRLDALSRQSYRPTLINALPHGAARQFANAAALLQRVPLFGLGYFSALDVLPAAAARLEAHVRRLRQ